MVHTMCAPHGAHHVCTMCVPCVYHVTWCTHGAHVCTCVLTIITASPVPLAMVLVGHRRALLTVVMVMMSWPLHGPSVCFSQHAGSHGAIRPSRRYQTTVYFTMIKDVLHIMFTLVRKRKDSSFWSYKSYCEWSQSLRVRIGSSRRKSRQHRL